MSKAKLTKQSISFLVNAYDDVTNTYTFSDIKKMIEGKFGIKVTTEAVRLSYHANKEISKIGDVNSEEKLNSKSKEKYPSVKKSNPKAKLNEEKSFEPIEIRTEKGRDFDEDAGRKYNPSDFYKK